MQSHKNRLLWIAVLVNIFINLYIVHLIVMTLGGLPKKKTPKKQKPRVRAKLKSERRNQKKFKG